VRLANRNPVSVFGQALASSGLSLVNGKRLMPLLEQSGATQNAGRVSMLLKNMVGPWGLEPQTSTVSILQQHTRPRGLPKYAEVHIRHTFCGLEKAGELQNRPTYFPERFSMQRGPKGIRLVGSEFARSWQLQTWRLQGGVTIWRALCFAIPSSKRF
jgi:hypothetical protein